MARHKTTHLGITMDWDVAPGRIHNAANPYTIYGYVDGVCRMQNATNARTLEQMEKRVISRLEQIAQETSILTHSPQREGGR